jgi:hypothetical protein
MGRLTRAAVVTSMTFVLMVLAMGPAFAHFCYNASRSEQGNRGAAASQAWFSIEGILAEEGLCPDGIEYFLANVAETGLPPDAVIHGRAVLANGRLRNQNAEDLIHLSSNGKGIDHLLAVDWDAVDELFEVAFGLCE